MNDHTDNSRWDYDRWTAVLRELAVRKRDVYPTNERECRWREEGIPNAWIDMARLDTVQEGQ